MEMAEEGRVKIICVGAVAIHGWNGMEKSLCSPGRGSDWSDTEKTRSLPCDYSGH